MRYKVGDVVRIRKDLVVGNGYADDDGNMWLYERRMKEDVVKNNYIATIIKADCLGQEQYVLDISDRPFFNDGMIEGCVLNVSTDDVLNVLGV